MIFEYSEHLHLIQGSRKQAFYLRIYSKYHLDRILNDIGDFTQHVEIQCLDEPYYILRAFITPKTHIKTTDRFNAQA